MSADNATFGIVSPCKHCGGLECNHFGLQRWCAPSAMTCEEQERFKNVPTGTRYEARQHEQAVMTDEDAAYALKSLSPDVEVAHVRADEILLKLLRQLGYPQTVDAFESLEKWYA